MPTRALTLTGEWGATLTLRTTPDGGAELVATGAAGAVGNQYERLAPHTLDNLRDWLCELRGLPSRRGER